MHVDPHFKLAYAIYLLVSIAMTIWVARTLSKSGEMFLVKCFGHDVELARSTNQLLVIGFYLINLGFICVRLEGWTHSVDLIASVGSRIGLSILILGGMHFFNMMMIARYGRILRTWLHPATENRLERAAHLPISRAANPDFANAAPSKNGLSV